MNAAPREAYVAALREDVCSICAAFSLDPNPDSDPASRYVCVNERSGACVVFAHLDATVGIVSRFKDSDLASLDNVYQMYACTQCKLADVEGVCSLRDRTRPIPEWCIADAYLPQVIGAIERVHGVEVG